ncbi:MAG: hypothetical protein ACK57J_22025 [Rubrivivax sp.]
MGVQLPGTYYDFTGASLPAPWDTLRRAGLGTRIDAAGQVGYGAHNLLSDNRENLTAWGSSGLLSRAAASSSATLPDGRVVSLTRMVESTAAAAARRVQSALITVPQPDMWVAAVVRGGAGRDWAYLRYEDSASSFCWVNLGTGALGTVSAGLSNASATSLGGGAWLVKARRIGGGLTNIQALIGFAAANNTPAYNGDGASSVEVGAVMLSAVDFYVPTTTAPVYLPRPTHNPSTLAALGILIEGQATNLAQSGNLGGAFITQTKTVTAVAHTFSFYGTGSVVLSGVHSATVNGTGANVLTSLTFTPSAGSLTMTVSGTVTDGQLETGTVATSRIPNPGTGTAVRTGDFQGLGISGASLTALFTPTAPFTIVLPFRKSYSLASVETILGLCAGASAGTTNQLGIATNGTQAQIVHSGGSGALTGTLTLDGSTVNRVAVSVDPTFVGPRLESNGDFANTSYWTTDTGVSIGGGVCLFTAVVSSRGVYRSGLAVAGKRYRITYTLTVNSGAVRALVASTFGTSRNTSGTYSEDITATTNGLIGVFSNTAFDGSLDDLSIQEVGAMSISVNGSAPVETTGIAYTGAGTTAAILGARDSSGGQPAVGFTSPGIRVAAGQYITGSALQALSV